MNKNTLPVALGLIILLGVMLNINLVLAWSSNTFNNSLTNENLEFTENGNITRYLSIPNSVSALTKGYLNLSGLYYINDTENSYWENGYLCGRTWADSVDENWGTFVYLGNCADDVYFYENQTLPLLYNKISIYWKAQGEYTSGTTPLTFYCLNYTAGNTWITLGTLATEIKSYLLPSECKDSMIQIRGYYPNTGNSMRYYEGLIYSSQINNSVISIVNSQVWNYSGQFNQTNNKTNNIASIINQYLTASYLVGSNYIIPFIFHSDTAGILQYLDLIFNNDGFLENSQTFNTSTYETQSEKFDINITYDSSYYTSSANLIYNGTSYTGTKSGTGNTVTFSKSLVMESVYGNKSLVWQIGLTNSSGTIYYNSSWNNQTVKPILFGLCNSTLNVTYINFTFKDETTELNMNASMDLATWSYGINGLTKSLIVSNTSLNNPNYAFCFSPVDKTISETLTFQYANPGYPQRQYYRSGTLTNSTTNQVLYLLGSGSGIYTTFVTSSSSNAPISGVTLQFERMFNGIWTLISQGTSDSAGSTTIWANPNYDLRVTATKTGYASTTVTVRPTQSIYTIVMGGGTGNQTYSSILEGITYSFYPPSNFLNKGTDYLFGFNINSSLCNLARYKIELTLSNSTILNYAEGTNSCGSNISLTQNTNDYNLIYARYYVDIGTGYYDISPSAYPIENVTAGEGSIWKAFTNLINYRSGSMADNYGQLWWLFFLTFVLLSVLCYSTGAELSNPGIVLPIVLLWVLMFSIMGFFTMNFTGSPGHPQNTWVNQYAIFFIALCFTLGYIFRRLSE